MHLPTLVVLYPACLEISRMYRPVVTAIDIGPGQCQNFPNFFVRKAGIMQMLPNFKATYDNYMQYMYILHATIKANYIKHPFKVFYMY